MLESKIKKRIKIKKVNGVLLNGQTLVHLAQTYTDAINGGAVPRIESAWQNVLNASCVSLQKKAMAEFESRLKEEVKLPMDEADLSSELKRIVSGVVSDFEEGCIGMGAEISDQVEKVREKLESRSEEVIKKNGQQVLATVDAYLAREYTEIIERNLK